MQIQEISPDAYNVGVINSIKHLFEDVRQESKPITFALTYMGTYITIMRQGFTKAAALVIEANYHKLYRESDEWVEKRIQEAAKVGYTTVAFGLRLRCPILHQTVLGLRNTPYEAASESRTVGNAQGQSYGMLNNRAGNELYDRLEDTEFEEDILPCADIHDAQYFLVRDSVRPLHWLNVNLIQCMQWQELPELAHDKVKLGAGLDVFHPNWSNAIGLPNNASKQELRRVCKEAMAKYNSNK